MSIDVTIQDAQHIETQSWRQVALWHLFSGFAQPESSNAQDISYPELRAFVQLFMTCASGAVKPDFVAAAIDKMSSTGRVAHSATQRIEMLRKQSVDNALKHVSKVCRELEVSEKRFIVMLGFIMNEANRALLRRGLRHAQETVIHDIPRSPSVIPRSWLKAAERLFFTIDSSGRGVLTADDLFRLFMVSADSRHWKQLVSDKTRLQSILGLCYGVSIQSVFWPKCQDLSAIQGYSYASLCVTPPDFKVWLLQEGSNISTLENICEQYIQFKRFNETRGQSSGSCFPWSETYRTFICGGVSPGKLLNIRLLDVFADRYTNEFVDRWAYSLEATVHSCLEWHDVQAVDPPSAFDITSTGLHQWAKHVFSCAFGLYGRMKSGASITTTPSTQSGTNKHMISHQPRTADAKNGPNGIYTRSDSFFELKSHRVDSSYDASSNNNLSPLSQKSTQPALRVQDLTSTPTAAINTSQGNVRKEIPTSANTFTHQTESKIQRNHRPRQSGTTSTRMTKTSPSRSKQLSNGVSHNASHRARQIQNHDISRRTVPSKKKGVTTSHPKNIQTLSQTQRAKLSQSQRAKLSQSHPNEKKTISSTPYPSIDIEASLGKEIIEMDSLRQISNASQRLATLCDSLLLADEGTRSELMYQLRDCRNTSFGAVLAFVRQQVGLGSINADVEQKDIVSSSSQSRRIKAPAAIIAPTPSHSGMAALKHFAHRSSTKPRSKTPNDTPHRTQHRRQRTSSPTPSTRASSMSRKNSLRRKKSVKSLHTRNLSDFDNCSQLDTPGYAAPTASSKARNKSYVY